jgi:PIN domain nuclease of toxin-antitoxin system
VNLLLDTHALLWWLDDSPRLGREARAHIAEPRNPVWVSAATAWEIAIKAGLGRLDLGEPPEACLPRELERGGFRPLAVGLDHALAVRGLPRHHDDPFDRMLIAQARAEGLAIVSADKAFATYDVAIVPADR